MKKMRGVVDPITLGFVLIALGAGFAATSTSKNEQNKSIVKTQVEAPAMADNRFNASK